MNFRRLLKMLETETDKEKIAEVMQKINSEITKKGVVRMASFGYMKPLEIESHICKRDAIEGWYFDCECWGNRWGYPVRADCIYIQPGYAGIDIVLSLNEYYAVSCCVKRAYIRLRTGINAPAADQEQIGELFRRIGVPRSMYNNCSFDIFSSASAANEFFRAL